MRKIYLLVLLLGSVGFAQTGIGTTTPVNKFQVEASLAEPATAGATANGNLRLSGSTGSHVLDFGLSSAATYSWIQSRSKSNYTTNYSLILNPNGGNVGIGTTTPTVRLHVAGDIIANSVAGSSDRRFKTNIRPVDNALAKVKALQGVYFNWNQKDFPEKDFGTQNELGFIAQEVEQIVPEIVVKEQSNEEYRSVKYDKLVALLVEAIKEQQKQIELLQVKVKKLAKKRKK